MYYKPLIHLPPSQYQIHMWVLEAVLNALWPYLLRLIIGSVVCYYLLKYMRVHGLYVGGRKHERECYVIDVQEEASEPFRVPVHAL